VGPSLGPGVPNLAAVERLCALTGVDKLICAQALRDCQGDVRAAAELLLTADPNNRGVAHTALPAAGPKAGPQPGVQDVGAALRAQDQAARLALQQEAVAQLPRAGGLSEELWAAPSPLLPSVPHAAAAPSPPAPPAPPAHGGMDTQEQLLSATAKMLHGFVMRYFQSRKESASAAEVAQHCASQGLPGDAATVQRVLDALVEDVQLYRNHQGLYAAM